MLAEVIPYTYSNMRTLCFTYTHTHTHTNIHTSAEMYCVYMYAYTNTQAYMKDNGREETKRFMKRPDFTGGASDSSVH